MPKRKFTKPPASTPSDTELLTFLMRRYGLSDRSSIVKMMRLEKLQHATPPVIWTSIFTFLPHLDLIQSIWPVSKKLRSASLDPRCWSDALETRYSIGWEMMRENVNFNPVHLFKLTKKIEISDDCTRLVGLKNLENITFSSPLSSLGPLSLSCEEMLKDNPHLTSLSFPLLSWFHQPQMNLVSLSCDVEKNDDFKKIAQNCPALTSLNLNSRKKIITRMGFDSLTVCPLRELTLHVSTLFYNYDKVEDFPLVNLINSLTTLHLIGDSDEVYKATNLFRHLQSSSLKRLSFEAFYFESEHFDLPVRGLPELEILDIEYDGLTVDEKGLQSILLCCPKLRELILFNLPILKGSLILEELAKRPYFKLQIYKTEKISSLLQFRRRLSMEMMMDVVMDDLTLTIEVRKSDEMTGEIDWHTVNQWFIQLESKENVNDACIPGFIKIISNSGKAQLEE